MPKWTFRVAITMLWTKFVDEEVLPLVRQDTAQRYVNSATCVAEFIHAPSLPKEKYGTLE